MNERTCERLIRVSYWHRKRWTPAPNILRAKTTAQQSTGSTSTSSDRKLDGVHLVPFTWLLINMEMNMYGCHFDRLCLNSRVLSQPGDRDTDTERPPLNRILLTGGRYLGRERVLEISAQKARTITSITTTAWTSTTRYWVQFPTSSSSISRR